LTATAEEEGEDEGEGELDGMFRKKERERAMRDEIVLDWDGRLDNVSVALSFSDKAMSENRTVPRSEN
jgi:hypothetical protein